MSEHAPMTAPLRHDELPPRPTLEELEREWAAYDAEWHAWELETAERRGRRQALVEIARREEALAARRRCWIL